MYYTRIIICNKKMLWSYLLLACAFFPCLGTWQLLSELSDLFYIFRGSVYTPATVQIFDYGIPISGNSISGPRVSSLVLPELTRALVLMSRFASGLTAGRNGKTPWKKWRGIKYAYLPKPQKFILPQDFNTSLVWSAMAYNAEGTVAGLGNTLFYRCNSPFDPDVGSAAGTRAYLFNQFALYWGRYLCYRSKFKFSVAMSDAGGVAGGATQVGAGLIHQNQITPTDPDELLQNPQFATGIVTTVPQSPASRTTNVLHWDLMSEPGAERPSYLSNVQNGTIATLGWDAAVTANPNLVPLFLWFNVPIKPTEKTPINYFRVDMIFDVYFFNEAIPADSDI